MSGLDPLAALNADAALAQSAVAAIDLGVQIEILQQQLSIGDLITATILPPQGGSDRLSLLGQTVLAQLPPGIDPGQSLLLQITGFQGNQILVRNIGVVDPNNPPPTVNVTLPPLEVGAPAQATLVTVQQQPSRNATQAASPVIPSANSPRTAAPEQPPQIPQAAPVPVAPPRAVFVAASVQPAQPTAQPRPGEPTVQPQVVVPLPEEPLDLEARIAATRAASIDLAELVNQSPPAAKNAGAQSAAAQTAQQQAARTVQQRPPAAAAAAPPPIAPRTATTQAVVQAPARAPSGIAPELELLVRLRIPALPFTLAAARLANNAASILPKTLARLDALLAQLPQADARAATVRTIAGFLTKIDLGNTRALPEQLMAYVNNVVDSAESKLAAIVRNLEPDGALPTAASPDPRSPGAPTSAASGAIANEPTIRVTLSAAPEGHEVEGQAPPEPAQALPASIAQPAIAAHAAERAVALQYDLKGAIASLADSPPRGATPQLVATLGEALTTITATQLNVANAQSTDPNAIAIPLPVFFYEGGRPAQLRISRDAPQGGKKLDADNFHIAFVLDTKSLGTVAVDVQTASRSVSVNVKTEVPAAASRFRDTFDDLRDRLEQLHYRVANVAASVAPHLTQKAEATDAAGEATAPCHPEPVEGQPKRLDLQA